MRLKKGTPEKLQLMTELFGFLELGSLTLVGKVDNILVFSGFSKTHFIGNLTLFSRNFNRRF